MVIIIFTYSDIVQQGFQIVVSTSHNNRNFTSAFDILKTLGCLEVVLVSIITVLIELQYIKHMVSNTLDLLSGGFCRHYISILVQLFRVAIYYLSTYCFTKLNRKLCFPYCCRAYNEYCYWILHRGFFFNCEYYYYKIVFVNYYISFIYLI